MKVGKFSGCIPMILLAIAIAGVNYHVIANVDSDWRIWLSIISAIFLSLGLISFWGLVRVFGRDEKSRDAMLLRAKTGQQPADGAKIIATGKVQPLSIPLISPISETECVMYMYRMFYTT
jgi:4-amino-4-deoxy-L-arabinose transferase-like glycosyltransferase